MGIRARARARACITHDHTTPHVVDIRSSVERRMIELYLNHRDRLINILDMIDGKERSVCAHLSKIGHRNVSPITRKCARARARESVQKKKERAIDPWSRIRGGFEKGWKKKKKALGRSRWMVFFSRIHEHREIIYGRRIGVLPRIIFEYRPTFVGDATFFFLFFLFSLSLFFFFRYTDRHTLTADNFIISNNTWRIEGVINRPRRW